MTKLSISRIALIVVSVVILGLVYVFQRFNFLDFIVSQVTTTVVVNENLIFIVNKSLRLVINDFACLMLIKGIFDEMKYLKMAYVVFAIEVCLLLPIYFYFKLTLEGTSEISSPLLAQIHRLIVNPMLMALVIISFFYQRLKSDS